MQAARSLSAIVLALLFCFNLALAGGPLTFLDLSSYGNVSRGDNTSSGPISTGSTRFEFGNRYISHVYVSTNGYFSMGKPPDNSTLDNIPGPYNYSVVAPFAADIDTTKTGTVKYTNVTFDYHKMSVVSAFIRDETGDFFFGSKMIVAEWDRVPMKKGSSSETNTFQGILIADSYSSYAVFIYKCGSMKWGGSVIGWQVGLRDYNSHYLSGKNNSNDIGCLYSNYFSAFAFKIDEGYCRPNEFRCYGGDCVPKSYQCDGEWDCSDGSDEENCGGTTATLAGCDSDEFPCDNGTCIPKRYRCNGVYNCDDKSDEERCTYNEGCGSDEITCDNGSCIPKSYRCNSVYNCDDKSDEEGCTDNEVNIGLVVGLTIGLGVPLLLLGVTICVHLINCLKTKTGYRRLQPHVVKTTPTPGATTVVPSKQPKPPTTQYVDYQPLPVLKDALLSPEDALLPSSAATYPSDTNQQPLLQDVPYPAQNQAYPPSGPPPNLGYPPTTVQAAP